ncbi:MAG: PepSY-associated TM helix domain-containing protein [Pseudomonadota bacterium]
MALPWSPTGLLIFLPNFFKDLFALREGKNKKRFWLDAHNAVGVISLPWHIMFAWSSVLLAISFYIIAPFQVLVFEEDLVEMLGPELGVVATPEPSGERAGSLPIAQLLAIAEREMPGMSPTQLRFEHIGDSQGSVVVLGKSHTDTLDPNASVAINSSTGEVLAVANPETASLGGTFYSGLISLHFASYGGYILKWIYFILGLAGAFLFYSGNLLWVESRRKRRGAEQTRGTVFMARLNSGVCIGAMAGISAAFLASRALMSHVDRPDYTEYAYFGVFFLAIAWCYLRPVAAGTRDLLYLCAALTAAIPIADAVFINMPLWRSVAEGQWPLVIVDTLAIALALAFLLLGRGVQARAVNGDPNSVWALPPAKTEPAIATA